MVLKSSALLALTVPYFTGVYMWRTGAQRDSARRFPAERRTGFRVSEAARAHGLLTRCIGDVLVLMPPYCVTEEQIAQAVDALWRGLVGVCPLP